MVFKLKAIIFFIIPIFLFGCSISLEHVNVPGQLHDWKVGYQHIEKFSNDNISEYIPYDESIKNWSKMVTVQFKSGRKDDPQVFMNDLKNKMIKRCENLVWDVIKKEKNSVLYEWRIKECSPHSDQHEIAKLILGNDGLHRVAYTEKVQNISPKKRAEWIYKLTNTYLEKDGKKINGL